MRLLIPTNKVPFCLTLGIKTDKPEMLRIEFMDNRKPNTYYVRRKAVVKGYREFVLNFPQTPKAGVLVVYNVANGDMPTDKDPSFKLEKIEPSAVEECPIWMKRETHTFVKFAQQFSENAAILSAGKNKPNIYRSDDAKFHIDYYDVIRSKKNNSEVIPTPARIGHNSGIIEVSKTHFVKYTVPMRMIILLHEYSHKYMNPEMGSPIDYETGADINALSIYLSLGYSPLEAHYAFLNVFKDANNAGNKKRYLIIQDFIDKFTNGEFKNNCVIGGNERSSKRSFKKKQGARV